MNTEYDENSEDKISSVVLVTITSEDSDEVALEKIGKFLMKLGAKKYENNQPT